MFQATRRRLALWYTIVTAVLFLVFATGCYFYVRNTLIERIDDTLKHVAEVVERSLAIEIDQDAPSGYKVNIEASFRDNAYVVEDDHIDLEWFSPQGKLQWSTLSDPLDIPLHPHRQGETVKQHLLRQYTESVKLKDLVGEKATNSNRPASPLGYLRVSHPWFEVTKPIRQLIWDLALGISLMVFSVAAIGWFLSGIAIRPVIDSYQSLKQFTADASHELRNPVAMIQTNVQMALTYPDTEAPYQRQQLQVIERLTQRLGRLVNDLLFLARSDSGTLATEFQPLPLDALLVEVMEEQRTLAEKQGIYLSLHLIDSGQVNLQEEIFTVQGDWDQLARLFTNLISNALEHAVVNHDREPPTVQVDLQRLEDPHNRQRQDLEVRVRDNGKGIPEKALSHIFDRFYRVDPSRSHLQSKSTAAGLGLAIAKAIVQKHQGAITVESSLGKGTTFIVTLPQGRMRAGREAWDAGEARGE